MKLTPIEGRKDNGVFVSPNRIWVLGGMAEQKNKWVWKNDIWASTF